ncbi:hypothetical protein [Arenimonas terrae]|uniref:Anti-sigma factor n=1 Tax=Arenimonas terrae TaxID=2546226 RepID=A0A5C4RY95_9GAMM|nr:hypothetical protein [Arenimonas terrae]TNJ35647.1 hypothetical protein E1B00_07835 [Arenimonas terrae]
MRITDEQLMAYADGELDAAAVVEVEVAIAADPALAEAVARHRALRRQLRDAFAPALDEPVPEHLLARVRAPAAPAAAVVPLRPRRRWALPEWAGLAAALALGVALSQAFLQPGEADLRTVAGGALRADGALAQALDHQLAADNRADARIAIGLSFRDGSGAYCRSFVLRQARPLAGLACRGDDGWHVPVTSEAAAENGELRPAAAALPPAVLLAVETRLAGDTLDADAERRARDAGWR